MKSSSLAPSPLLSLPLELRTQIYSYLLCPTTTPSQALQLFHDRHGKAAFGIDPTILRVNRQIHDEAISMLYEGNQFEIVLTTGVVRQCTGGNYPDTLLDPPEFFRQDGPGGGEKLVEIEGGTMVRSANVRRSARRGKVSVFPDGIIHRHCFQRLKHLRLVTTKSAIWGHSRGGSYFSYIGCLIIEILNVLNKDLSPSSPTKVLEFVDRVCQVRLTQRRCRPVFMGSVLGEKTLDIAVLLKELKIRRVVDVWVEEPSGVSPEGCEGKETTRVDLDEVTKTPSG